MTCHNPIIPGFAPDPSIVQIQDTFYLVTSSFHLFPGLPIYASKDLLAWRHIGNAINRPTQLDLSRSSANLLPVADNPTSTEKAIAAGGLYAPTIRHHNGTAYIVCTNVIHSSPEEDSEQRSTITFENFIISTPDIGSGSWSDPVPFVFNGIDPDLFFDDNGRAYVSGSSWDTSPSTINCFEIDIRTGAKLSAEAVIWEGYSRIIPEGPHIYKRNGWYYLLDAEGGTHESHMIAIARARDIWGPYEPCEYNPILPPAAEHAYCQFNGHGDLVQDTSSEWWLVCLGVRKDREGRIVLGRETFLTPVEWPEERPWPRIQPIPRTLRRGDGHEASQALVSQPGVPSPFIPTLDYVTIRHPPGERCDISPNGGIISLRPSETDLNECTGEPISFIGRRQRLLEGSATAILTIDRKPGLKIGLAYYKDEHRYARLYADTESSTLVFELVNRAKDPALSIQRTLTDNNRQDAQTTRIGFRILYTEKFLHFLYRFETHRSPGKWQSVSGGLVDITDLTAADFTGPVIGVFAVGKGDGRCTFEDVDI
ncbi:xylosidase/arabinosidase [Aspergillus ustus]|uniref:Xylosidase/arabinosidase n=1 Tax=Aspergillus ustus TaxID=40382 RepID=A0A0C1BV53_ASPUT|nr:xylosidase/arabinosidase [Aspergillus ustus]